MSKGWQRIPPKGSFSTNYSSPCFTPEKAVKGGKGLEEEYFGEDLSEMCSFAKVAFEKTSEVQQDIAELLGKWEEEKNGQGEAVEVINKRLERLGLRKIDKKRSAGYYLNEFMKIINELDIKTLKIEELTKINKELELTARTYKVKFDAMQEEIKEFREKVSQFIKIQSVERKALDEVKKVLNCDECESLIPKIRSLRVVIKVSPKLQSFVEEICKEFVPEADYGSGVEALTLALGQVFSRIRGFKEVLEDLVNFKVMVYESLCLKVSGDDREIKEVLRDINQLFKPKENGISERLRSVSLYISQSKSAIKRVIDLYGVDPHFTDLSFRELLRKLLVSL